MEIQLLEKDKDSIKIQIKEADMTLISPLVKELLEDELVTEVKYTAENREAGPTLYVKVSSGKPQTASEAGHQGDLEHLQRGPGKAEQRAEMINHGLPGTRYF